MADNMWYYAKAGQQLGPVNVTALQAMARSGELRPADLVWTAGMANWQPAGELSSIFPPNSSAGGTTGPHAMPSAPAGFAPPPRGPIPVGYYNQQHHHPGMAAGYAGFWLRFLAAILDGIIVNVAAGIVGFMFGLVLGIAMAGAGATGRQIETFAGLGGNLLGLVIGWLYAAFMESSQTQATLGKMAVGIKVTDLDGNRITFGRATGRYFAKILSAIILMIGYIMAAFTEKKQALHDMLAGTLVMKK